MKKALFLSHTVNPFNLLKLDSIYAEAKRLGWAVQSAEFGWTAWSIADIVAALKPDGIIFDGGEASRPCRSAPFAQVSRRLR